MGDGIEAAKHEKEVGCIAAEANTLAREQSHPYLEVLTGHVVVDTRTEGRTRENAHVYERKTVHNTIEQVKHRVDAHMFVHDIIQDVLFILIVEHN